MNCQTAVMLIILYTTLYNRELIIDVPRSFEMFKLYSNI